MNKVIEDAKKVNKYLKDLPLIKEYKRLDEEIKKDARLNQIHKEMESLVSCDISDSNRELYYKLSKEYNSNPLVINRNELAKEIENLELEIKDYLEL